MKRLLSIMLICVMLTSLMPISVASEENADKLFNLGLFKGTGNGYALENTATRIQGLIMLIRLLGEEEAALSYAEKSPFGDIGEESYKKYATYGYLKGYTSGTGENTFSPNEVVNFKNYITFLLRALGYNDKVGDFTYNECLYKAYLIGLIDAKSAEYINVNNPIFYRGDLVDLSIAALTTPVKGQNVTLAEALVEKGVFSLSDAKKQGVIGAGQKSYTYTVKDYSTIIYSRQTIRTSTKAITADVLEINLKNPKVALGVNLAENTIGASQSFGDIVASSSAKAVVNGNFFESYAPVWYPVGHVMVDGEFAFGSTGRYAFGFTDDGEIRVGKPALFFYVRNESGVTWACYELNTGNQTRDNSVLYNHFAGSNVEIKNGGTVVTVSHDVVTEVRYLNSGEVVQIPENGYVMYFGDGFINTGYYQSPEIGDKLTMTPELFVDDAEGFKIEGVTNMVSGGPRLVKGGVICNSVESEYNEARFTTAVTTRTAVGRRSDGKLIIVSTPSASIKQLSEVMYSLGCTDAINLDGGASTAFAYDGKVVRAPGRKLTTTIHIFEK